MADPHLHTYTVSMADMGNANLITLLISAVLQAKDVEIDIAMFSNWKRKGELTQQKEDLWARVDALQREILSRMQKEK